MTNSSTINAEDEGKINDLPVLVGHEAPMKKFLDAWHSAQFPHSWVIEGELGVGKSLFARHIISHVLGSSCSDRYGKKISLSALRAHAVREITVSEKSEERGDIKVETVHEAFRDLQMTRIHPDFWRILIIDPAECLNIHSANLLLKTLEEPLARTLILLVTEKAGGMLPTILSRCSRIRLGKLSESETRKALAFTIEEQKLDEAAGKIILAFTRGRPGLAFQIFKDERKAHLAVQMQKITAKIFANPEETAEITELARQIASKTGSTKTDTKIFELFLLLWGVICNTLMRELAGLPEGAEKQFFPVETLQRYRGKMKQTGRLWTQFYEKNQKRLQETQELNLDTSNTILYELEQLRVTAQTHHEILHYHRSVKY